MKANFATLLVLLAGTVAAAEPAPPASAASPAAELRVRLTDKAIRQAVRETLAENRENPRRHEADVLSADKYQVFSEQFGEAKVPDCLHADALKRQPPRIGPFAFKDLFAVPFVVLAKLRGKCL